MRRLVIKLGRYYTSRDLLLQQVKRAGSFLKESEEPCQLGILDIPEKQQICFLEDELIELRSPLGTLEPKILEQMLEHLAETGTRNLFLTNRWTYPTRDAWKCHCFLFFAKRALTACKTDWDQNNFLNQMVRAFYDQDEVPEAYLRQVLIYQENALAELEAWEDRITEELRPTLIQREQEAYAAVSALRRVFDPDCEITPVLELYG